MCFHNSFSFSLLEIFFISLRVFFLFISFFIINFVLANCSFDYIKIIL